MMCEMSERAVCIDRSTQRIFILKSERHYNIKIAASSSFFPKGAKFYRLSLFIQLSGIIKHALIIFLLLNRIICVHLI
jgi:hypothetical protein